VAEIEINCEESRCFFIALSPENRVINQKARAAALNGQDLPGIHNTMCGVCVKEKITDSVLNQKREEWLHEH
jgi:hypothetical protein